MLAAVRRKALSSGGTSKGTQLQTESSERRVSPLQSSHPQVPRSSLPDHIHADPAVAILGISLRSNILFRVILGLGIQELLDTLDALQLQQQVHRISLGVVTKEEGH